MGNACRSGGQASGAAPARPPPLKLQSSMETESDKESDEESAQRAEERLRRIETAREGALKTLRTSRALSMHDERRRQHIQNKRQQLGLSEAKDANFGGLRSSPSESESEGEGRRSRRPSSPTSGGADATKPPERTVRRRQTIFGPCGSDPPDSADSGEAAFGNRQESGPAEAAPDLAARLAEAALADREAAQQKKSERKPGESGAATPSEGSTPPHGSAGAKPGAEKKQRRTVCFGPGEGE